MTDVKRIRGRALQTLRASYFTANPLCAMCKAKGIITIAVELDHILAITNGGTNDWDNYQGLCIPCHEIKTQVDLGYTERKTIGEDGWPIYTEPTVPRWIRAERTYKRKR